VISLIPRLPDLPEKADAWVRGFYARFNLLWREMAGLINARFDDLESQGTFASPSASTLELGIGNRHRVSGTTTINLIAKANLRGGSLFVLHFTGALTIAHNQAASGLGKPLMLTGSANLAVTANDQVMFQYDVVDDKIYQVAPIVAI
jgi:hypothetical protein